MSIVAAYDEAPQVKMIAASIPKETAFSIMFVTVGMSCFIWQAMTAGWMFYKARKPIIGIVFAQSVLGIVVTFVTLLTSLVEVDCTFVSICLFYYCFYCFTDYSIAFIVLCGGRQHWRYVITICAIMESVSWKQQIKSHSHFRNDSYPSNRNIHWGQYDIWQVKDL